MLMALVRATLQALCIPSPAVLAHAQTVSGTLRETCFETDLFLAQMSSTTPARLPTHIGRSTLSGCTNLYDALRQPRTILRTPPTFNSRETYHYLNLYFAIEWTMIIDVVYMLCRLFHVTKAVYTESTI